MEAMEEENETMNKRVELPEDIDMSDCVNVRERVKKMLLAPPEYENFRQLGADMLEMVSGGCCKFLIIEEGNGPLVPEDAEVEIHYAAYWEHQTVPFDSSVSKMAKGRKKMRLGDWSILPGVDSALSMVRGPKARLILLAPVPLPLHLRRGNFNFQDALFVISLYSVKGMTETLPLPQKKAIVPVKTLDNFKEKKRGQKVKYDQPLMGSWGRYFEAHLMNRVNTGGNNSTSLLQNFDYLTDFGTHCKALFHYGKAFLSSGRIEIARKFYRQALTLEPRNHVIGSKLAELNVFLKKFVEYEAFGLEYGFDMPLKRKNYDVDWEFEYSIRLLYRDLEERNEDVTIVLPKGLSDDEEICVRNLATAFEGLAVREKMVGRYRRLSVVSTRLMPNLHAAGLTCELDL